MADDRQHLFLSPVQPGDIRGLSTALCSMEPWLAMKYTREAFEFYLLHADQALSRHAVMISGQVAGVLAVRSPWLFGPLIELMALFDGFRSRGAGKKILECTAERYEAKNLWVTVASVNLRAQKFYERQGFQKTALLEELIMAGRDEILLRKKMAWP